MLPYIDYRLLKNPLSIQNGRQKSKMASTKFGFFVISTSNRGDFPRIIVIDLYKLYLHFLDFISKNCKFSVDIRSIITSPCLLETNCYTICHKDIHYCVLDVYVLNMVASAIVWITKINRVICIRNTFYCKMLYLSYSFV